MVLVLRFTVPLLMRSAETVRVPPPPMLLLNTPPAALVSVPLDSVKFDDDVLPLTDSSEIVPALEKLLGAVSVAAPKLLSP